MATGAPAAPYRARRRGHRLLLVARAPAACGPSANRAAPATGPGFTIGASRGRSAAAGRSGVGTGTVLAQRRAVDAISSCGDVELILTAARHRRSARSPRLIIRRRRCALRATTRSPAAARPIFDA
jgi:hypothetical protein